MLLEIDRLQLATHDAPLAIQRWRDLLGAEEAGQDRIRCLGARRTTLRLGRGVVDILEADGAGPVADALARRGPHLFSAGASSRDVAAVQHRLADLTRAPVLENGQLFVDGANMGIPGLRLVVSEHQDRPAVGRIDYLYEATVLADDADGLTARFASAFALDAQEFVAIDSPRFGYSGKLTLFQPGRLHRFEVITPLDPEKTMGRFFRKTGPCLYMCFAESHHLADIQQRVAAAGLGQTVDRPADRPESEPADQVWLHPPTLGGVMLGLSRPTMAWTWSGAPDRVEPL